MHFQSNTKQIETVQTSRVTVFMSVIQIDDVIEFTRCSNLRGVENFLVFKFTRCVILRGVKIYAVFKIFWLKNLHGV